MKKILSFILCLIMIFASSTEIYATDDVLIDDVINNTADCLYKSVSHPSVGSVGGEWSILGFARSDVDMPNSYFENYYQTLEKYVKDHKGVLHEKKYTEYSRVILALTSIGKNPKNVAGYNLITPLGDYEGTIKQGINGSIWALIALDSVDYEMPKNTDATIQATREMYINHILNNQTADGGWALSGNFADVDTTAMAMQALAKYKNRDNVSLAIEKALDCVSQKQNADGGFSSGNAENAESSAQMLVALCTLGISPYDIQFIKNGKTIIDSLMTYYENGKGFKHTKDGTVNLMATEQCFYAFVALKRFNEGKNSLYNMSDTIHIVDNSQTIVLENKHTDVNKKDIVYYGKTFDDITNHKNKTAIEELLARNIVNGKNENKFEPDNTMTRAEFATIIVRGLGLPIRDIEKFTDVLPNDWFCEFVNTAYYYGIVSGVSDSEFNPNGVITREEAAVMVARAAKLCGNDTNINTFTARNILAGFADYVKVSDWAMSSLAFCYNEKILLDDTISIQPGEAVTRAEIAQMLYNMLLISKLI